MGKPQDLPAGQQQMQIGVGLSFLTYVVALSSVHGLGRSMAHAAIDLMCSALFIYFALQLVNRTARFAQSFGALCGAGAIVNTAAIPIFRFGAIDAKGEPGSLELFAEFLLVVWSLSLFAYILRHTFEIKLPISILMAFLYILVLSGILEYVFSTPGSGSVADHLSLFQSFAASWLHSA